jgi:Cys-tRNA(Pro)/Cys-tRNA(Cys) deacylase
VLRAFVVCAEPHPPPQLPAVTPAIRVLERAHIVFRVLAYAHDPAAPAYGLEAAAALGIDPGAVFKTLIVTLDGAPAGALAVAMVPVDRQVDLKAAAIALGAKRATLADVAAAERATGYVVGGISPIGQRRSLPTILDASARRLPELFVSAGRRGLEIALAPEDLLRVTGGTSARIAR